MAGGICTHKAEFLEINRVRRLDQIVRIRKIIDDVSQQTSISKDLGLYTSLLFPSKVNNSTHLPSDGGRKSLLPASRCGRWIRSENSLSRTISSPETEVEFLNKRKVLNEDRAHPSCQNGIFSKAFPSLRKAVPAPSFPKVPPFCDHDVINLAFLLKV